MIFGRLGLLKGLKATIYPGMEECLIGATPTGQSVCQDGTIVTGQGPALAMEFALKLVEVLKGKTVRDEVASGLLYK